jgi:hypothetical protein
LSPSTRFACEADSATVVMSSESCTSLVSNVALELLEIVVLRFCARCV